MLAFSKLWPELTLTWPANYLIAQLLLALSVFVGLAAILNFRKHKTTVNPTKPEASSSVVTSGIYRFSRNPMYLAMLLALISLAYFLQHLASLPVILIFIAYMTRFQIIPEEKMLTRLFGQQYIDYQMKVRRWL